LHQGGMGNIQQVCGFLHRHFHSGHRVRLYPHCTHRTQLSRTESNSYAFASDSTKARNLASISVAEVVE
jgi:hypothetical protein